MHALHILVSTVILSQSADAAVLVAAEASSSPVAAAVAFAVAGLVAVVIAWAVVGRLVAPLHLAYGFGTAVAMWCVGYIAMMRPGVIAGEVLFALMLGCVVGGSWLAARAGGASRSGIVSAVVSAVVNLLVVGSLFGKDSGGTVMGQLAMWGGGLLAGSAILGAIGGAIATRRGLAQPAHPANPTAIFATVATVTVFLLLITGGLVTGLRAGLAVPDWPNSFGHNMLLYPLAEMKGGIYYEHAHRLFGTLVGLSALVLAAMVWRTDSRGWTRGLSLALVAAVVVQGLMGALRVTGAFTLSSDRAMLNPSTEIGFIHGIFAQVLLAGFALLACAESTRWRSDERPVATKTSAKDRRWPLWLVLALLVQLALGAAYRHFLKQDPDGGAPIRPLWAIHAHITMAFVVLGFALHAALRALRQPPEREVMRRFGGVIGLAVLVQVMAGFTAWMVVLAQKTPDPSVALAAVTTAHQAVGALLLLSAVCLTGWSWRLLAKA